MPKLSLEEQIDRALKKLAEKPGKHLVVKAPPRGGKAKGPKKRRATGWRVVVHARHRELLLGGVPKVTSSAFKTRREAEDFAYAMLDQPNANHASIYHAGELVAIIDRGGKGGKRKAPGKGVKVSSYARHWPDVKPRKKRRTKKAR